MLPFITSRNSAPGDRVWRLTSVRSLQGRPLLVAILGGVLVWVTAMVAIAVVYLFVRRVLLEDLRNTLARTASYAAALIDGDGLAQFTDPSQDDNEAYRRAVRPLRALLANNPDIRFAFVGAIDGDRMHFILDGTPLDARDPVTGKPDHSPPMEYDELLPGELEFARTHRLTVESLPSQSAWGMGIRAQAPVLDSHGNVIAYVGITMRAERYHRFIHQVDISALLGAFTAAVLGGVIGFGIWRMQRRQKMLEEQLGQAARRDRLTGLANRSEFMERLEAAIARVNQNQQSRFAVLFLDFDRFKLINDTLGHGAGDELLRQIADRLLRTLRASDTVLPAASNDVVSRFGGDEFLLLLNDIKDNQDAVRIAERLLAILTPPYDIYGNEVHSTASIGVLTSEQCRTSAEEVLRNADVAMYEAKRAGRACTVLFDETMHSRLTRHVNVENSLRRAIGTSELYLLYQPIVDLKTGRMVSAEALIRWNHPVLGVISPSEFIPIAEETGLIVALGAWVQDQACAAMAAWRKADPLGAPEFVSVNVSRAELATGNRLLTQVRDTLERHRLPPGVLQLEITEREIVREPESMHAFMLELREFGTRLAIDDFGNGTSSLGLLRNFPVDTVKIDRSFIQDIGPNTHVLAVIHAAVTLVENLGMASLAEGVETQEQVAVLLSLGCRYAQGFYFSDPVPAEELLGVLKEGPRVSNPAEAILSQPIPERREREETERIWIQALRRKSGIDAA